VLKYIQKKITQNFQLFLHFKIIKMNLAFLQHEIDTIINSEKERETKLQAICDFLENQISYYDWVGFYFKNGDKRELKLAQFTGEPTEHTIIPFGKGICGQVAVSNQNFVVQDVSEQENYISCGWKVKSEIVIPIFVNGENIGQIDIDSHSVSPFTKDDEVLLEYVCEKVANLF
jgi:GAF domain-containing protein